MHHFILKAKLSQLTVQNLLARIKTEDNPRVLVEVKEAYEKLVEETKENGTAEVFYGQNSKPYRRERSHSTDARINDAIYKLLLLAKLK